MFERFAWLLAAPLVAGAVTATGSVFAAGVSDNEIVLGTHLDLSGPASATMPDLRNGMQMRIDEANEAGGVHGRKLRLIVEDNALSPAQAVRATQKLTRKDEVFAIVQSFGSGPSTAAVKTAVEAGVVYFAPWAASAIVQAQGGKSPLVFTTIPNYDATVSAGLGWAIGNWKVKKIGVIYQGDALGELVRAGVKKAMDAAGQQPVAEASYKPGDVDFSSQVARMRQAGAEVIVLATLVRETINIMSEVKKIGWSDVKVLTAPPARAELTPQLGKAAVEGLYGIGHSMIHVADSAPPAVKAWMDSYRKRFNIEPRENTLFAYAYADWFVKGLQAAGRNLTTDSFIKAVNGLEFVDHANFGPRRFRNGHAYPEVVRVQQVQGGRWVDLTPNVVASN